MIELKITADGVLLPVLASAGSRQNAVRGQHSGSLRVAVTQAPEKGKANKAIIGVLASSLLLRKSQISLAKGDTCSSKIFLIRGIDAAELRSRIDAIL